MAFSSYSFAQKAHVHGVGNGSILINKQLVQIDLVIPAESIIGFEHKPRNNTEKNKVDDMFTHLQNQALFHFFEKPSFFKKMTQTQALSRNISIKFMDETAQTHSEHNHHHHHSEHDQINHHHHQDKSDTHLDIQIKISYEFEEKTNIKKIETTLFDHLSQLDSLKLSVVKDDSSTHETLSKRNSTFKP